MQDAIDRDVFQLDVTYHPHGYPTQIFIDLDENLADDTIAHMSSNLVDLPEPGALPAAFATLGALWLVARSRCPAGIRPSKPDAVRLRHP